MIELQYRVHECPDNISNGWDSLERFTGNVDTAFQRMYLCDANVFPQNSTLVRTRDEIMRGVDHVKRKYPHLWKIFQERGGNKEYFDLLIARQNLLGMFSNISLSVHPHIKKVWKIQFEMFGTFWNTNNKYCCMFPALEQAMGGVGNAWHFTPQSGIYLVNPPYTEEAIEMSLVKIQDWLKNNRKNLRFIIVIPVWDKKTRQDHGIIDEYDMPKINEFLEQKFIQYHRVFQDFPFYDYLKRRDVVMPNVLIHFIIAENIRQ